MNKYYDNSTFFRGKLVLEKLRRKNFVRSKSFIRIKSNDSTTSDDPDMNYKDKSSYTSLALACKNTFYPPSLQLSSPSRTRLNKQPPSPLNTKNDEACFTNRTQNSIKADRRFKEYFYHCITNIDYPMRVNYCWNFSSNHEKFFKTTVAKQKLEREKSMMSSRVETGNNNNYGSGGSGSGSGSRVSNSCLNCVSEKMSFGGVAKAKATKKSSKRDSPKLTKPKPIKFTKMFRTNSHLSSLKVKRNYE